MSHEQWWQMRRDLVETRRLWKNVEYSCPRNTKKYWYWIHCPNCSKYIINECFDFETRWNITRRDALFHLVCHHWSWTKLCTAISGIQIIQHPPIPPKCQVFEWGHDLWPPTLITLVCDQKPQLFCAASKASRKCCMCFRMFTLHVDLLCFFNLRGSVTRHFFRRGGGGATNCHFFKSV